MTKEQLRSESMRLAFCKTLSDSIDLLKIFAEFMIKAVSNHHFENTLSQADAESKILFQMMMSKVLNLMHLLSGISYETDDGLLLNKIIDPTVIASLTRNVFETTATFNLIYINTKNEQEKEIIYLLWVHAGLKYRQQFLPVIRTTENIQKSAQELSEMASIAEKITSSEIYTNSSQANKKKIDSRLKIKEYLIVFEDDQIRCLKWHEMIDIMELKQEAFQEMYTYLSLYSHPSNVSVFQFAAMFAKGKEAFPRLANYNVRYAIFLFAVFIADYIKLFPSVVGTFNSLKIQDQIAINLVNMTARGTKYSINDCVSQLED